MILSWSYFCTQDWVVAYCTGQNYNNMSRYISRSDCYLIDYMSQFFWFNNRNYRECNQLNVPKCTLRLLWVVMSHSVAGWLLRSGPYFLVTMPQDVVIILTGTVVCFLNLELAVFPNSVRWVICAAPCWHPNAVFWCLLAYFGLGMNFVFSISNLSCHGVGDDR